MRRSLVSGLRLPHRCSPRPSCPLASPPRLDLGEDPGASLGSAFFRNPLKAGLAVLEEELVRLGSPQLAPEAILLVEQERVGRYQAEEVRGRAG